ncbi:hypothetical protein CASFOL_005432 [Castilleja foliolosa]|uniref:Uncharacterized protein n=1 Tax=Castilleja foliolosa TaxID=1961234 RepID=A0ABD3E7F4_9LAMI
MPFPMRIQPIDYIQSDAVKPPVSKSRLKRLFDRPFNGVLRISSADKPTAGGEKDGGAAAATTTDFEPSSVLLDKMVQSFIEGNNEKQSARNRCNCFNGNSNDSSDDELDFFSDSVSANSSFDPSDTLKSLIQCQSMAERNLLADTSRIVEKNNKTSKRKDDLRKIVNDGLISLGYNASICKSKWEKTSSIPAGKYEYIDVIIEGQRILIDVDFRSEFEIARSTTGYRVVLQCLPYIFVGKINRLLQIVSIASEAARLSLKKKGMHVAPWRKTEYVKSKWLSPHTRIEEARPETEPESRDISESEVGELDLIFGEKDDAGSTEELFPAMTWQLPAMRPKSLERGKKAVVTGLASLLKEKL